MNSHPDCPGCATARAASRRTGNWELCRACGAEVRAPGIPEPQRTASVTPQGEYGPDVSRDTGAPRPLRARSDMALLARFPAIRAMPIEPEVRGYDDSPDDDFRTERERKRERDKHLARYAARRLAAMRAHEPDGARYADIVWYVYGVRGEELDKRESAAKAVAERFARQGERAAFRAQLARKHTGLRSGALDKITVVAFGNALIGAATAAYERDEWPPIVEAKEPTARERFVGKVAEAWGAVREKVLGANEFVTNRTKP